jgi:hypothetical protein
MSRLREDTLQEVAIDGVRLSTSCTSTLSAEIEVGAKEQNLLGKPDQESLVTKDATAEIKVVVKEQNALDKNGQESLITKDADPKTVTDTTSYEALQRVVDQRKSIYEEVGNPRLALALESVWRSGKSHDLLGAIFLQQPTHEQQREFQSLLQYAMTQLAAIGRLIHYPNPNILSLVARVGKHSASLTGHNELADLVRAEFDRFTIDLQLVVAQCVRANLDDSRGSNSKHPATDHPSEYATADTAQNASPK